MTNLEIQGAITLLIKDFAGSFGAISGYSGCMWSCSILLEHSIVIWSVVRINSDFDMSLHGLTVLIGVYFPTRFNDDRGHFETIIRNHN